jgi:hypothetical protein
MERKKVYALVLASVLALGGILVYNSLNQDGILGRVNAEPITYQREFDESVGPASTAKHGFIPNVNMSLFYLSESAQTSSEFIRLKAKDANTPAILMNFTVANGLKGIAVNYTGGDAPLYALYSRSAFEDYAPTVDDIIPTGETGLAAEDYTACGYFLLMTYSTTDIVIEDLTVYYSCQREIESLFYYQGNWEGTETLNHYTGARSWGNLMGYKPAQDGFQFMTNPTSTTNNYSSGHTHSPTYDDSWYRWNGVSMRNYVETEEEVEGEIVKGKDYSNTPQGGFASNHFEVTTTVMVDPDIFYDEDAWFHVCPWVSLATADHQALPDAGGLVYMQSYIGNDNFDPIGGIETRTDTYRGRFFTNYAANGGGYAWGFQDPDTTTVIGDPGTTLREAYEAINLPIFNVRYVVSGNSYDVFINGFNVYHENEAFYFDANYVDQEYSLETIEFHGVNYGDGVDSDGEGPDTIATPLAGYLVSYTNPIVREIFS